MNHRTCEITQINFSTYIHDKTKSYSLEIFESEVEENIFGIPWYCCIAFPEENGDFADLALRQCSTRLRFHMPGNCFIKYGHYWPFFMDMYIHVLTITKP